MTHSHVLTYTCGDIQQVEHVLQKVVPEKSTAADADAQIMRTRVRELGVLQFIAVCYSLLQCVAMCFSAS